MSNTERKIIVIPASESLSLQGRKNRQMRVASYSRVSTDFEEQLTSFHAQKSYYTDLIMRPHSGHWRGHMRTRASPAPRRKSAPTL